MITEKNELIEAYLTNKLPASETASFEAELAKDPALQHEVDLQKDIINTLQDLRKAELKNRLSQIEVNAGLSNTQKFGIAAVALSSLLLLTFGLYEYNKEEIVVTEPTNVEQKIVKEELSPQTNSLPEVMDENENTVMEAPKMEQEILNEVVVVEKPKVKNTSPTVNSPSNTENLAVPTPLDFESEGSGIQHDELNAPKDSYSDNENNEIRAITPKIDNKDKKVRMYKYDGENLTLIGDFSSADPYYIIESPKYSSTELYLKFDNTFYAIRETKKAATLEKVTDKRTLIELSKK